MTGAVRLPRYCQPANAAREQNNAASTHAPPSTKAGAVVLEAVVVDHGTIWVHPKRHPRGNFLPAHRAEPPLIDHNSSRLELGEVHLRGVTLLRNQLREDLGVALLVVVVSHRSLDESPEFPDGNRILPK